jgi:hypothetical protein
MHKVALIIIYNHQHNENIEILERIYKDKFSNIYHLVPFYNGEKTNVIPVYECSYYFQGYVSQGFKGYFKESYTHYFFVADDLILSPKINENNYTMYLKLNSNTCFLPGFITLHERKVWWPRVREAFHFNINFSGFKAKNELPKYNIALQKFKKFGLEIMPLRFNQIWETPSWKSHGSINDFVKMIFKNSFYWLHYLKSKIIRKKYKLSYPLVGSYSDIFVVSSDAIKQFYHYCGVFAAANLFVEIGLPTSLVLSAEEIVTENDLKLQGKALWPDGWARLNGDLNPAQGDYEELERYNFNLKQLLDNFPENYIYLHPVKLLKWNTEL